MKGFLSFFPSRQKYYSAQLKERTYRDNAGEKSIAVPS